ncbi:unnamed protein product [Trichobilharzia szidati]|nr:unnamed protein product [Trichobilharzia szidati]
MFDDAVHSAVNQSKCPPDPQHFDDFVLKAFEKQPNISEPHFYSQAFDVIRALCKRLGVCSSLETTLAGFIFDELDWCNSSFTGYMNDTISCGCDSNKTVIDAFWRSASAEYAKRAFGKVVVVLNGSVEHPFREHGVFASVELPQLTYPRIQQLTVKVIHNLGEQKYNHTCESPNIKKLEEKVKSKNITYHCIDEPA